MRTPARTRRNRFRGLITLLVLAIAACLALAYFAARGANRTLNELTNIEFETAQLARQFRGEVDDLHGAILRIGSDSAEDSAIVIAQRRQRLSEWLSAQLAAARNDSERQILNRLADEVQSYFLKLDGAAERTSGFTKPLDRDSLVMFDDSVNRLESMADDFAAVHDADLQALHRAALGSVEMLRNLVFICTALLIIAIGVLVFLLYRDVVSPLRVQLVESKTLLAQREKLAALGTLAAGVAHEIRNPLTAIKARLYTLRRGISSADAKDDATAIAQEIERLERIVRDVLGYARPADSKFVEVELTAWLRELSGFLRPELEKNQVDLLVNVPPPVHSRIDTDQIRQVILNLVRNAEEAFDGKPGKIELSLDREKSTLHGRPAEVVVLNVTDNGPGIPENLKARLFDPFFTTKPSGTGLGLSIVARLVEQHGGEITFQSAPKAGTRFSVRLPIHGPTNQTSNS